MIGLLTLVGLIAACPWLLMVWLAHEQVRQLASTVGTIKPAQVTDDLDIAKLDGPAITEAVTYAMTIWTAIERCALALALIVSTAVLNTGALRLGLIDSSVIKPSDFPSSSVVGYGFVYATVVAIAIIPLMLGWRTQAVALIDQTIGPPAFGIPGPAWIAARERLQGHLGVDSQLLRRLITAFSLLSPLITAFLTALVPSTS